MAVLFLPGASPETLELMQRLAQELALDQSQLVFHRYKFWQGGPANVQTELNALGKQQVDVVIAKSLGTLIFAQAVFEQTLTYRKAVLLGTPLPVLNQMGLDAQLFERFSLRDILFVSQEHDKLCPAADIEKLTPPQLLTINGSDHGYLETQLYVEQVRHFLS